MSAIAILMALTLAIHGVRNRREPPKRLLVMFGAWIVIIIVFVLLIDSVSLIPSS